MRYLKSITKYFGHTLLIVLGLLGIMYQMIFGLYPFSEIVSSTFTLDSQIVLKRLVTVLYLVIIALGVSLREVGKEAREMLQTFTWAMIILVVMVAATGGFVMGMEANQGTTYAGQYAYFTLDSMSSQVIEWYYITKIVFLMVPMGVIIIGVVMIFRSDEMDGYITAIIEIFTGIGIITIGNTMLSWSGIDLFNFDPSLVAIPEEYIALVFNNLFVNIFSNNLPTFLAAA